MHWNGVANMQYSAGSALAKSAECKTILQITQSPIEMAMVVKQSAIPYNRLVSWALLHMQYNLPRHIYEYMFKHIVYTTIHFSFFFAGNSVLTATQLLMSRIL
jgi:hypothetical protein